MRKYFRRIITFNDVRRTKPDPEGLLRILGDRHRQSALYLGDNVDDAIAARRAGIPFLGVLPRGSTARRIREAKLRDEGALAILGHAREVAKWLK